MTASQSLYHIFPEITSETSIFIKKKLAGVFWGASQFSFGSSLFVLFQIIKDIIIVKLADGKAKAFCHLLNVYNTRILALAVHNTLYCRRRHSGSVS